MQRPKILIVDDESTIRIAMFRALEKMGYQVLTSSSMAEALSLSTANTNIDLFVVDMRLPDGNAFSFMENVNQLVPKAQVLIMTGYGSIDDAVKATRLGAIDYVTKPFNIDDVTQKIASRLPAREAQLSTGASASQKSKFDDIIGDSPEIKTLYDLIETIADTDSTILITGESGTGKELVARAIHANSSRSGNLLVPVNCGAIPEELLESELFGHVKGAFTGAISNRQGRFEVANGGTLFLDEIGDMSPSLQVKLLRVLQERKFEPVGSTKTIESDVRIIAATHHDLEASVRDKKFREDLFYRLNVIPIRIPPLRDRKSDIPQLAEHFIKKFNTRKGRDLKGFTPEAMEILTGYSWPGNIRELENLIERLVILKGRGLVEPRDLPERYQASTVRVNYDSTVFPDKGLDFNSAVDQFENNLITQALEKTGWNRNKAASLLNLNRTTLVEKIKKKGLAPER